MDRGMAKKKQIRDKLAHVNIPQNPMRNQLIRSDETTHGVLTEQERAAMELDMEPVLEFERNLGSPSRPSEKRLARLISR